MHLFLDGAGHYDDDQIHKKYTAVLSTGVTWTVTNEGRFNNCVKRTNTSNTDSAALFIAPLLTQEGVWTPTDSGVFGYALKVDDLTKVTSSTQGTVKSNSLFTIMEGPEYVFHVTLNESGTLSFWYHSEGGLGNVSHYVGSSVQGLRSATWAYIEFKWLIHATDGTFEARMNGVPIFTYTGRTSGSHTGGSYTGVWNTVRINTVNCDNGQIIRHCDLYLADLEEATDPGTNDADVIKDFVGDINVDYIIPEDVGDTAEFTPSAGANWENVDDVPPDDDATYNEAEDSGLADTFVMSDLPAGTEPVMFQTVLYARKTGEGNAMLTARWIEDSVNYDAPQAIGVPETDEYQFLLFPYDVNPATGNTLTEAEANADMAGYVKVV